MDWFTDYLFDLEKSAMTGDRMAAIQVIGMFRELRTACKEMLDKRYRDGEVDGATLHGFENRCEEILCEEEE